MDMDKAAIYQAYASSPQIYVLNEPSSNLDKKGSQPHSPHPCRDEHKK